MNAVAPRRRAGNVMSPRLDRLDLLLGLAGAAPDHREAWVDRYLVGLPAREIGAREGITTAGVQLRIEKANRAIRAWVELRDRRKGAA